MNEFWINFWADFLSNLGLVIVLAMVGFLAKAKVVKSLRKFIRQQVSDSLEIAEEHKEDERDYKK
jgi:3-polyprenyl-4-hydroxybenzoate decarboxylase